MKILSRHNEGVMIVTQNNDLSLLTVIGMNENLRELLGYEEAVDEAPLSQFLGSAAEKMIKEDVEFEDDARDLLEVLRSHRQLRLLKQNGVEVNLDIRIMRSMARDRHHLFRLVFSTPTAAKHKQSLSHLLKQSFSGYEVTDTETGLPNAQSVEKYIELTQAYIDTKPIKACFVYMRFEHYPELEKLNKKYNVNVLSHISRIIKRNLRDDDTVGRIAEDALGIILVDINEDTVHLALNRIKHMVLHDPIKLSTNHTHTPLVRQSCAFLHDSTVKDVPKLCVELLDDDEQRDMVVFRDHSKEFNMFGSNS